MKPPNLLPFFLLIAILASQYAYSKAPLPSSIESITSEEPPPDYIWEEKAENKINGEEDENTISVGNNNGLSLETDERDLKRSSNTKQHIDYNQLSAKEIKTKIKTPTRGTWIHIDTEKSKLYVMKNNKISLVFHNISFGRNGPSYTKIRNDEKTPIGRYKVMWINRKSQYRLFFGLNYPNKNDAKIAFNENIIDYGTFNEIVARINKGKLPSQRTPLGGNIGIHGLGDADPIVHKRYNWTKGCIALTNKQILRLKRYIKIGTIVVIK